MLTCRAVVKIVALAACLLLLMLRCALCQNRFDIPRERRFLFDSNNQLTGWTSWEHFAACSTTCVTGYENQTKACCDTGNNFLCYTLPWNTLKSYVGTCAVDGVWSAWSLFTRCSVSCGSGIQFRTRTCAYPTGIPHGNTCPGPSNEHSTCVSTPCPVDGVWLTWSAWSQCSATCGGGIKDRQRQCYYQPRVPQGDPCLGSRFEQVACNNNACPLDGGWSEWDSWTACSVTCEIGTKSRNRTCTNPIPQFKGADCQGSSREVVECVDRPSCKINGSWSEWSTWFGCSTSCGDGLDTRYRACNNPPSQNGGLPCQGSFKDAKSCNLEHCPIDGGWSNWTPWSPCASSSRQRYRDCINPPPQFGGLYCTGSSSEIGRCTARR